jgi:hypothetical protein
LRWLAAQLVIFAVLATIAADLLAHKRVELLGGVNIWGYRGPIAHQRQPNEIRIVFVGGTRAFGWGEPASGTTAAAVRFELTRVLDRPNRPLQPIVAINLGQLGASPASYVSTIEHFAYLRPDYIGIFDDLGEPGPNRPFDASGIFTLTGYRPMLPLVLQEKGRVTRNRLLGAPLEYSGDALAFADRTLARVAAAGNTTSAALSGDAYASAMAAAIGAAHEHARGVVVVLSPIETERQRLNMGAVLTAIGNTYGQPAWLRIVDLQEAPELYDRSLRLDGFSFAASATSIAARTIAPQFLELITPR